jgi:hypothetical protein
MSGLVEAAHAAADAGVETSAGTNLRDFCGPPMRMLSRASSLVYGRCRGIEFAGFNGLTVPNAPHKTERPPGTLPSSRLRLRRRTHHGG